MFLHRLSEIMVPTLIVWGARDPILPPTHAYAAARLITNCQLEIWDDCGHSIYRDRPVEFSRLLRSFLD